MFDNKLKDKVHQSMLNKSNSLRSFDTGLSIIRDNSFDKKLPNYFNRPNGKNLYFEKSFQTMKTAKKQKQ